MYVLEAAQTTYHVFELIILKIIKVDHEKYPQNLIKLSELVKEVVSYSEIIL